MYPECNHFGGGCYGCNPRLAYPFGGATVGQFIRPCPSPHHPAFQPPAPSPRHPAYQPAPSPKHPACRPSAPPEPPQQGTGYHPSPHAGAGIGYPVNCMPPPSPMPAYYVPVASPTRIFSTTHVTVHLPQTAAQPALSSKSKRRRGPWFCGRCCEVEVA